MMRTELTKMGFEQVRLEHSMYVLPDAKLEIVAIMGNPKGLSTQG
jgi:hypothetical protein